MRTFLPSVFVGLVSAMAVAWSIAFLSSCGRTPAQDVHTGLDVNNAICTALAPALQPEPDWLILECSAASIGAAVTVEGGVLGAAQPPPKATFRVRIPARAVLPAPAKP
jgi:hypothetical protein